MDPAMGLRLGRAESRPTPPITMAEVARLLDTIRLSGDSKSLRDEALFAVYAFTGIRRSEALALRISDYDPLAQTLRLPRVKGGGQGLRHVPKLLIEILDRYISVKRTELRMAGECPMFPGRDANAPLSPRQAQLCFDHWKQVAGLRTKLTLHSFRAGFATRLHESSRSLLLVSRALGHRSPRTAEIYIGQDDALLKLELERAFS